MDPFVGCGGYITKIIKLEIANISNNN